MASFHVKSKFHQSGQTYKNKNKVIKRKSKFLDVDETKSVQRVETNFGKRDFLNEKQVVSARTAKAS